MPLSTPMELNNDLITAAAKNDLAHAQRLLADGAQANFVHKINYNAQERLLEAEITDLSAIQAALKRHDFDMAQLLVDNGADINQCIPDGYSLLHLMVAMDNVKAVQWLLTKKANPHHQNIYGQTPLFLLSSTKEATAIAKLLLDAKADPNVVSQKIRKPIHCHINFATFTLLLEKTKNISLPAVFALACQHKEVEAENLAQAQLEKFSTTDWDFRYQRKYTALHFACLHVKPAVVKELLLLKKFDVNVHDEAGDTPFACLLQADKNQSSESIAAIAVILIKNGADINAQNNGVTLLEKALKYDTAIARLLLKSEKLIFARDSAGDTCMHHLAQTEFFTGRNSVPMNTYCEILKDKRATLAALTPNKAGETVPAILQKRLKEAKKEDQHERLMDVLSKVNAILNPQPALHCQQWQDTVKSKAVVEGGKKHHHKHQPEKHHKHRKHHVH